MLTFLSWARLHSMSRDSMSKDVAYVGETKSGSKKTPKLLS